MTNDPIVEEVRMARQELFEQCGSDLEQFMDFIRRSQSKHEERLITSLKGKKQVGQSSSASADLTS